MKTLPEGYYVADNYNHISKKEIEADAKELKDYNKAEHHAAENNVVKQTALVWFI